MEEHFCQVHAVYTPEAHSDNIQPPVSPPPRPPVHLFTTKHSANIDPDNLFPSNIRAKFTPLLDEYNHIFDPNIKGYSGAECPFEARVDMGRHTVIQRPGCQVTSSSQSVHQADIISKIPDDVYCGRNSPGELLLNWQRVLQALHKCDLCLSTSKTIINPQSTTILAWIWNSGTSSVSPHRITPLAPCPKPNTVA